MSDHIHPPTPPASKRPSLTLGLCLITAAAILATLVVNSSPSTAQTTSPPAPAAASPAAASPSSGGDWNRIKATRKLVVATSIDYPPFTFYNTEFQPDGFDIALIQEIAKRLGLVVEINDYAFDGLLGTLQLKQADVAIAALSITPQRQKRVDFSSIYFSGNDAYVVPASSSLRVRTIDDLYGKKIGAQNGSVYATQLRDQLVDQGKVDKQNLLLYSQISGAAPDLQQNRIDVAVMGLLPAQDFIQNTGFRIAGQGLNRQNFGIAVPQGSDNLRTSINSAINVIRADGTFDLLVAKYLKVSPDDIQPIPETPITPVKPAIPAQVTCIDGASFVADLNYDDQNMTAPPIFGPGQRFTKTWRFRNSGNCAWKSDYAIAFSYGTNLGGLPVRVGREVAPGETIDLSADVLAPFTTGTFQSFWSLVNSSGVGFGEVVWIGLQVPAPPTPLPPPPSPTAPPDAQINFSANPTRITSGQPATLIWRTANVQAVYFYQQGDPNWASQGVAGNDQRIVYPTQTTVYELRTILRDGNTDLRQIRIDVAPNAAAPVITALNSNPQQTSQAGQCINFNWNVSGAVDRVSFTGNGALLYDYAPVNGSFTHCPALPGTIIYELIAYGPGGSTRQQLGMQVLQNQPVLPSMPTPIPEPTLTPIP